MADPQEFRIQITSTADNSGVQSADAAYTKLKGTTEGNTDATNQAAKALPLLNENTKKGAEEAEKFEIKKRGLLEATRKLTAAFPELGEVMRAVYDPETIGIFAVIAAFEIWKTRVDNLVQAEGAIELPDFGGHVAQVESAATAYEHMEKAVAAADTEFDSAASAFERQSKAIESQLTATQKLIEAQKKLAEAELDRERQRGQVGAGEYAARKNVIENGASDANVNAVIAARDADEAARKAQLHQTEEDQKKFQAAADKNGLPQDEATRKAAAADLEKLRAANESDAEKHRAASETEGGRDADISKSFSGNIGDFIIGFGAAFMQMFTYGPFTRASVGQQKETQAEIESARAASRNETEQEKEKERDKLREENQGKADASAGDVEKQKRALEHADDPNWVGSTAWQDAQDRAGQRSNRAVNDVTHESADETLIAGDIQKIRELIGRTDPAATAERARLQRDLNATIIDALSTITAARADGVDPKTVADMQAAIARLQSQMGQTPYTGH